MYWVQMKNSACVSWVHLLNFHLEAPFFRYILFLNISTTTTYVQIMILSLSLHLEIRSVMCVSAEENQAHHWYPYGLRVLRNNL